MKKYSILREMWSVPKYRTLFKLGGYLLFFVLFYSLAIFGGNKTPSKNIEKNSFSYSTMKKNLSNQNLIIKYQIKSTNEYYIEGTIINEELKGTLELNDTFSKIKVIDDEVYKIIKNEEIIDQTLFNDINLIFLFPKNIINILNENSNIMKRSEDNKVFSYTIDNKSYSVFINDNMIEKIIILDDIITYTLEYSLIK